MFVLWSPNGAVISGGWIFNNIHIYSINPYLINLFTDQWPTNLLQKPWKKKTGFPPLPSSKAVGSRPSGPGHDIWRWSRNWAVAMQLGQKAEPGWLEKFTPAKLSTTFNHRWVLLIHIHIHIHIYIYTCIYPQGSQGLTKGGLWTKALIWLQRP